ncbi:hypothetical protein K8R42_00560 [bacterium]|nr:hypothetical protein [bacterium]
MAVFRAVKVLYKDKLAFWLLNLSVLAIIATWSLIIYQKIQPDPLAVLHYNIYSGIDVIGHSKWLYIIPAVFLGLSIINFFLAILIWTKQRIFSYFLLITILLSNIFIFLYLYNILNYNA